MEWYGYSKISKSKILIKKGGAKIFRVELICIRIELYLGKCIES
jgi:hypothetical protein